jgi:hypothetical protein
VLQQVLELVQEPELVQIKAIHSGDCPFLMVQALIFSPSYHQCNLSIFSIFIWHLQICH